MRLHPAILAGAILASTIQGASAGINSSGSGLYPSETLSTPPSRQHGGYWSSRKSQSDRQHQASRNSKTQPK